MPDPRGAVSLEEILKQSKVPTDLPPEMARGLDLNIIRNKRKHQHRWNANGQYLITDDQAAEVMAAVDEAKQLHEQQTAAGVEMSPVPINVPLVGDQLMAVNGPGCLKCGLHVTAPEGFGKFCERSDDDFPGLADIYTNVAAAIAEKEKEKVQTHVEEGDNGATITSIH